MSDAAFPTMAFAHSVTSPPTMATAAGTASPSCRGWGFEEARVGFWGEPAESIEECRMVTAICGGVRVTSVYVPTAAPWAANSYELKLS